MANIKNLRMWDTICTNNRISVKKSMFGLHTTAIYKPTGSIIDARVLEFSPADGEQLMRILCSSREDIPHIIGNFRPEPIRNGNYLGEVCISRDGIFLTIQLYHFYQLNYNASTNVLVFEGEEARMVGKMF